MERCATDLGMFTHHQPALAGEFTGFAKNENGSSYCYRCKVELDIIEVIKNGIRISIEYVPKEE